VPHPYGGEIAKAFVVLAPGETATKKDITQFAAARLAKHKVPRAVEFRAELPKSAAQRCCVASWPTRNEPVRLRSGGSSRYVRCFTAVPGV
jgi:acyl-CoA synthetase (AMP-forming)/AMP-acid ligase II